jgi:glycosyltransferase involved in cell wall biosynthesis
MKILIAPSWYPTEDEPIKGIFFREQAAALHKAGHEVIVVVFDKVWSFKTLFTHLSDRRLTVSHADGFPVYRLHGMNYIPHRSSFRKYLYVLRFRKLYRLICRKHWTPDVIHAHGSLWAGFAAAKLKRRNVPLILTEHATAIGRGLLKGIYIPPLIYALQIADQTIAVGEGLRNDLETYNVSRKEIKIVPNLIDTDRFKFIPKKSINRREKFVFLSLALLTEKKGMDVLIRAFSRLQDLNAELIIGGDGDQREALETLAKGVKADDRITFLGEVARNEVPKLMHQIDSFVLASRFETFGIVYIEALASGKPVIGTRCGGPEMIINEKNGFLVPVDDEQALAEAMRKMILEYDRFNLELIREDCINRFSERSVVSRLEHIYTEELQKKRSEI